MLLNRRANDNGRRLRLLRFAVAVIAEGRIGFIVVFVLFVSFGGGWENGVVACFVVALFFGFGLGRWWLPLYFCLQLLVKKDRSRHFICFAGGVGIIRSSLLVVVMLFILEFFFGQYEVV